MASAATHTKTAFHRFTNVHGTRRDVAMLTLRGVAFSTDAAPISAVEILTLADIRNRLIDVHRRQSTEQ
jgi:hypothetical protein